MFLRGFKTYLGIAIAFLGGLAGHLDVQPADTLPQWLEMIVLVAGSGLAWYGRRDKERRAPE